MARNIAVSVENKFVNGLITEATALNFPESAVTETDNCVYKETGKVSRRLGIDFESGYAQKVLARNDDVVNTFEWRNAGGNGNNTFIVAQVGQNIMFYKVSSDANLSPHLHATIIDINTYAVSGAPAVNTVECQFAYGYGYLFVTHPYVESFYVAYDLDLNNFTTNAISIEIRDFKGFDDGYEVDERKTGSSITDYHKYNLYNQSWAPFSAGAINLNITVPYVTGYVAPYPDYKGDPYRTWVLNRGDQPANSDISWLFKDAYDNFNPRLGATVTRGNSPAPKGHYILKAFYQDRSAAVTDTVTIGGGGGILNVSIPGLPVTTSGYQRPKCVAFFAGRVWYGGVDYNGYNNKLYFSQIVNSPDEFGKCYQNNDPIAEQGNDLLATDGGEIAILDCGTILKIIPLQSSLVVFCNNGIWAISGSTGIGFTASDYSIRKISTTPSVSASSFVDVGGYVMWWNEEGIYTIQGNDSSGQVQVESLSEKKIKTYFKNSIPVDTKTYAKGYYNPLLRTVQWLYRSVAADGVDEKYDFDSVLVLNINTGAFYLYSVDITKVKLNGIIVSHGFGSLTRQENVTDLLGAVVTASGGNVTTTVTEAIGVPSSYKYFCSFVTDGTNKFTWAEELDETHVDWVTLDGVGSEKISYFVSGYKVHGDAQKDFQSNYIFIFSENLNPSHYFVQGLWDYSESGNTGRWSSRQRVDFEPSDYGYRIARRKIRGRGKSLQLKFTSVSQLPFDVVGWSILESGNTAV